MLCVLFLHLLILFGQLLNIRTDLLPTCKDEKDRRDLFSNGALSFFKMPMFLS